MSTVPARHWITVQEYLAQEEKSLVKHEYYRGEIFAMAGATIPHNIIAANILAHLHARLRGTGCRPFGSDQRVKVEAVGLFTYPDVTVICGPVETAKDDPHSATNPRVLVEVLSEATEAYDRGRKLKMYLQLDSLREYVLVSQDELRVDVLARSDDGRWTMSIVDGLDAEVPLASIHCRLAMADIYEGVEFGKPNEPAVSEPR
jgi:Uma2 family endonuclease